MRTLLTSLTTSIIVELVKHYQPKILAWLDRRRAKLQRKRRKRHRR